MLFNSYEFILFFLPTTIVGWFWLGQKFGLKTAQIWLVGASLLYYGWWNPKYLILLGASMIFNYLIGIMLSNRSACKEPFKMLLFVGISLNLACLSYFKYAHFILNNINEIAGTEWVLNVIILPLAISFFTFQQIAYLVDSSRGLAHRGSFSNYALFVCFFPQLIAGPIVHHKEMMPQFADREAVRVNWTNIAVGFTLFTLGLGKKVLLADPLSERVELYFGGAEAGHIIPVAGAWYGVLAYSLQIYFDFSGYTDMALGIAKMFNITLPRNFNSPYQARNVIEFWRRWHITLSRFLKDYVYIPLGGNRHGKTRRYTNLMVTMLLGGLWHGASWTFLLWGALHGLYLCINHSWRWLIEKYSKIKHSTVPSKESNQSRLNKRLYQLKKIAYPLLTLLAIVFAWVFFRAESFDSAFYLIKSMFGGVPSEHSLTGQILTTPKLERWIWLIILWGIVILLPNTQNILKGYRPAFDDSRESHNNLLKNKIAWHPTSPWAWATAGIFVASFLSLSSVSEFLYYNF